MRASSLVAILGMTTTLVIGSGSCREPTQVTLVLTTSVPCGELRNGVAITVTSTPERANALLSETSSVTTTTKQCEANGTIGTLVVLPGDEKGAVVVTAGYGDQQTVQCTPANNFKDCIVARRAFTFVDHKSLTIPIELSPDCVNVPCNTFSTCKSGACVPSDVTCDESGCNVLPQGDGGPDSAVDSGVSPDASPEAGDAGGSLVSDPLCGVSAGGPMALQDFRGTNPGLPKRYCVDRFEVTQAAYQSFLKEAGTKSLAGSSSCTKVDYFPATNAGGQPTLCDETTFTPLTTPNAPVVCVDPCDARGYCQHVGKRLCSGDEWPAACQNDRNNYAYPYGAAFDQTACNGTGLGVGKTVGVGTLPKCVTAGSLPLFDMSGNVWEWTEGPYSHGGSFREGDSNLLSCRFALGVSQLRNDVGFRCCKSVD